MKKALLLALSALVVLAAVGCDAEPPKDNSNVQPPPAPPPPGGPATK